MHYRIQMREAGQWWTLGGEYDAPTADDRVVQFMAACTHKSGVSREFRVVAQDGTLRPARKVFQDLEPNPHIGSTFDSFLVEAGLAEELNKTLASVRNGLPE